MIASSTKSMYIPTNFLDYLQGVHRFIGDLLTSEKGKLLSQAMEQAVQQIASTLKNRLPVLVCGNGGSASDAMHITGELVGRFFHERQAFKVICLSSNPSVLTCIANDDIYDTVFSRQVEAYGESGGILLGISTSGNSENIIRALKVGKSLNMTTIGLSGQDGGKMKSLCDILLEVPSTITPQIQELHVCLYHYLCARIEEILK